MRSITSDISYAIKAAGGAISFEKFMDLALNGQSGFYTKSGMAGRRGDFITSPEVGPLFGAVLANAIDARWKLLGKPEKFTVIEVGAGPGTLARSVLQAQPECVDALTYFAVEVSETQRNLHPNGVISCVKLPTLPITGMIIANELLDNLPFRLFVFDGAWREAFVVEQDGKFLEILQDSGEVPAFLPSTASHGTRVPVQDTGRNWLKSSLEIVENGSVLVIDYCMTTQECLGRPWRDWLRTYRQHQLGVHYLSQPGEQDITAHVMTDQLQRDQPATHLLPQAQWLALNGINELVDQGRKYWHEHSSSPDVKAMMMRSRISEAQALCDPNGLGSFVVLEFVK